MRTTALALRSTTYGSGCIKAAWTLAAARVDGSIIGWLLHCADGFLNRGWRQ